jgi:hypothetical protein
MIDETETDDTDELYDVIVYEIATGIVDTIAGERMREFSGFYNANKRLETVLGRINDRYDAAIVETGKYKVGDVYKWLVP